MLKFKSPRYFTHEEFVKYYPNLESSLYRADLVYADPSILTEELMRYHINYLEDMDKVMKKHLEDHGGFENMPLEEALDSAELFKLLE